MSNTVWRSVVIPSYHSGELITISKSQIPIDLSHGSLLVALCYLGDVFEAIVSWKVLCIREKLAQCKHTSPRDNIIQSYLLFCKSLKKEFEYQYAEMSRGIHKKLLQRCSCLVRIIIPTFSPIRMYATLLIHSDLATVHWLRPLRWSDVSQLKLAATYFVLLHTPVSMLAS